MNAIRLALPSIVMAAIDEEEGNTAIRIPPLIDWLSTQQAASRLVTSRRLIEEIDTAEPPRVIPKVEGFRFLKPSPVRRCNVILVCDLDSDGEDERGYEETRRAESTVVHNRARWFVIFFNQS
jgi:hypothetical protein